MTHLAFPFLFCFHEHFFLCSGPGRPETMQEWQLPGGHAGPQTEPGRARVPMC